MRRAGRWLFNWRNGATVVVSLVVALVAFVVIDASRARDAAIDARNQTAAAATRRVDLLNDRIEELGGQLALSSESNGARLGALAEQVAALQEQVRQLGGDPVIVVRPAPPPSPPTTSTTTSTTSPPTTTTTLCRVNVLGRCIGGPP